LCSACDNYSNEPCALRDIYINEPCALRAHACCALRPDAREIYTNEPSALRPDAREIYTNKPSALRAHAREISGIHALHIDCSKK